MFHQKIIQIYSSGILFWIFRSKNRVMRPDFDIDIQFVKYNFFSCLVSLLGHVGFFIGSRAKHIIIYLDSSRTCDS